MCNNSGGYSPGAKRWLNFVLNFNCEWLRILLVSTCYLMEIIGWLFVFLSNRIPGVLGKSTAKVSLWAIGLGAQELRLVRASSTAALTNENFYKSYNTRSSRSLLQEPLGMSPVLPHANPCQRLKVKQPHSHNLNCGRSWVKGQDSRLIWGSKPPNICPGDCWLS